MNPSSNPPEEPTPPSSSTSGGIQVSGGELKAEHDIVAGDKRVQIGFGLNDAGRLILIVGGLMLATFFISLVFLIYGGRVSLPTSPTLETLPAGVTNVGTQTPFPNTVKSTSVVLVPTAEPPTETLVPTPAGTPTPYPGKIEFRGADQAPMAYVPSGMFTMGSTDQQFDDVLADCPHCPGEWMTSEKPQHPVNLDEFWIDQHEVTNAQYAKCVDANKCGLPSSTKSSTGRNYYGRVEYANYPVIYVTWNDANAYCQWADKKLPTEAQWEKAARGTDGRLYPWGNEWDGTKVNSGNSDTTAVGQFPDGRSPYGVLDMAGNVWEWVNDWYDPDYYANSPSSNPQGPVSGQSRILRGGSWLDIPSFVRTAHRFLINPDEHNGNLGFRCAH